MEASGWLLAWVAVQTRGQGAPSAALCLLSVSESACEGSQPSFSSKLVEPDESASSCTVCSRRLVFAAVLSRCLSWLAVEVLGVDCNVAMSELTRCVFTMLGACGCAFRDI